VTCTKGKDTRLWNSTGNSVFRGGGGTVHGTSYGMEGAVCTLQGWPPYQDFDLYITTNSSAEQHKYLGTVRP
jgi:hypothetical protein